MSASRLSLESHCLSPCVPKQIAFSYSPRKMKLIYSGDSKMYFVEANGCSARRAISGKHLCRLIKGRPLFRVQIIYMRCRPSQSGPAACAACATPPALTFAVTGGSRKINCGDPQPGMNGWVQSGVHGRLL